MKVDRLFFPEAVGEVVAIQHLSHGDSIAEVEHVGKRQRREPVSIAVHLGRVEVDDFAALCEVVRRVFLDLLERKPAGTSLVATARVTDQRRIVSDNQDRFVAEFLELPHLAERHGVTQVNVDAGRVDAVFDPQRRVRVAAVLQFLSQLVFRHDLFDTAANDGKLFFDGGKRHDGSAAESGNVGRSIASGKRGWQTHPTP